MHCHWATVSHIDTAQFYGNKVAVGRAIRESDVPRDDIFLTTKVRHDRLHHDDLIASLRESLDKFGIKQVDLALIRWPSPEDEVPMAEYIAALNEARELGLARHIGVSNFTIAQIDEALSPPGGEHIVTNQIEVHPFLANRKLAEHCADKGIAVTGVMPLAVGKVMEDETLKSIAAHHEISAAQVALAWASAHGINVIPSSTKPRNQQSNLEALDVRLTPEDIQRIDALDRGERIANPDFTPNWDE